MRQRREQRRARTDDLRAGLAALGRRLPRPARGRRHPTAAAGRSLALDAIADVADRMQYNPGEVALLEGLLARLSS